MSPEDPREMILRGARNAYPHAVSISDPNMRRVADRLVRAKLLLKGKFKDGTGYRLAYEPVNSTVKRERPSGPAYEKEVADATKLLRQSLGLNAKKSPTRR